MRHATAELINDKICFYDYNLEKRPDFYEYLYSHGMTFIEFMFFCQKSGYPEKRDFLEVYRAIISNLMDD